MHRVMGLIMGAALSGTLALVFAQAAPAAISSNIKVVTMPRPEPVAGAVRLVFFAPGSTELTPAAQQIVRSAVRVATAGEPVTIVIAQPAGFEPAAARTGVWSARKRAVDREIARASALQVSSYRKGRGFSLADRQSGLVRTVSAEQAISE